MMKCREREYCKMTGRANINFAGHGSYRRGQFYCQHPDTDKLPVRALI